MAFPRLFARNVTNKLHQHWHGSLGKLSPCSALYYYSGIAALLALLLNDVCHPSLVQTWSVQTPAYFLGSSTSLLQLMAKYPLHILTCAKVHHPLLHLFSSAAGAIAKWKESNVFVERRKYFALVI